MVVTIKTDLLFKDVDLSVEGVGLTLSSDVQNTFYNGEVLSDDGLHVLRLGLIYGLLSSKTEIESIDDLKAALINSIQNTVI